MPAHLQHALRMLSLLYDAMFATIALNDPHLTFSQSVENANDVEFSNKNIIPWYERPTAIEMYTDGVLSCHH